MEVSNPQMANVLIQALPYIKNYNNKIVVIKYGGNAMIDDELTNYVMKDIVLLQLVGIRVVLIHGGGPEINAVLSKMNMKSQFINGLRITTKDTIDIVLMVLAGKNKQKPCQFNKYKSWQSNRSIRYRRRDDKNNPKRRSIRFCRYYRKSQFPNNHGFIR